MISLGKSWDPGYKLCTYHIELKSIAVQEMKETHISRGLTMTLMATASVIWSRPYIVKDQIAVEYGRKLPPNTTRVLGCGGAGPCQRTWLDACVTLKHWCTSYFPRGLSTLRTPSVYCSCEILFAQPVEDVDARRIAEMHCFFPEIHRIFSLPLSCPKVRLSTKVAVIVHTCSYMNNGANMSAT